VDRYVYSRTKPKADAQPKVYTSSWTPGTQGAASSIFGEPLEADPRGNWKLKQQQVLARR
jgi:hypothetical protein